MSTPLVSVCPANRLKIALERCETELSKPDLAPERKVYWLHLKRNVCEMIEMISREGKLEAQVELDTTARNGIVEKFISAGLAHEFALTHG